MIGKLKGLVDEIGEDFAIIDVNGVGYVVFASQRTLLGLTVGMAAELIIETQVREDHISLFGFPTHAERDWFRLLLSVQRVGAKMALAILGAYQPAQLLQMILARDITAVARVSGVGPKLAERIVTELKDKAVKVPTGPVVLPMHSGTAPAQPEPKKKSNAKGKAEVPVAAPQNFSDDVVSALVNLGYGRTEAYGAAAKAIAVDGQSSLDNLIRLSLKELAR